MNYNEIGHVCPFTNRRCITIYEFSMNHVDDYGYLYNSDQVDLEPWVLVDGVDAHNSSDKFDVWFASGDCIVSDMDDPIYVK